MNSSRVKVTLGWVKFSCVLSRVLSAKYLGVWIAGKLYVHSLSLPSLIELVLLEQSIEKILLLVTHFCCEFGIVSLEYLLCFRFGKFRSCHDLMLLPWWHQGKWLHCTHALRLKMASQLSFPRDSWLLMLLISPESLIRASQRLKLSHLDIIWTSASSMSPAIRLCVRGLFIIYSIGARWLRYITASTLLSLVLWDISTLNCYLEASHVLAWEWFKHLMMVLSLHWIKHSRCLPTSTCAN